MGNKSKLKGIVLAIAATISFSNVYLFSKMAMEDSNLASFGVLWFGLALVYNLIYNRFFTQRKSFGALARKSKKILLLIGCSEFISISAFFLSIQLTENPAIVSFLANTSPIFVIIIGFLFYKTRYSLVSILGVVITLSGVLIMNTSASEFNWQSLLKPSSISALIFALFYGVSLVLARSEIKNIPTTMISVCRNLFLFIGFTIYLLWMWEMPQYSSESVFYIALGSLLGPFLGILLTYASLQFVDASITTLIGTSRSIFIVAGAFAFMGILPSTNQLLGGTCTILGILIITIADIKLAKST
ncbi:DMT family transporter [Marinifilum caeruleilacunae]|jgi:drug/metabolite transporter (DMT)-like permease|uniref:DMT family transporter n=1 Tax=Marinifilum caeruleilacunae TaxID=2499076 RepID=A0ABX1WRU1_9BACT|nr:DMT family transporter [Marinifilum caeruleilacunae]NOU58788.1 DMT family transporter [Marinifilum caeruleilacunae]